MNKLPRALSLSVSIAIIFTIFSILYIRPVNATNTNLALYKDSFTSVVGTSSYLNDGSTSSGNLALSTIANWFIIDLGANYNITSTNTNFNADAIYYYQIDVSSDKMNWITIVDHSTIGVASNGFISTDTFSAQARYVRYTNIAGHASASVTEFEVIGDSTPVSASVSPTDVAQHSASNSTTCTYSVDSSNRSSLIDGGFSAAGFQPAYSAGTTLSFIIDLTKSISISKFLIAKSWTNPLNQDTYSIQVSNSSTAPTTSAWSSIPAIITHSTASAPVNSYVSSVNYYGFEDFYNTTARFVKFNLISTTGPNYKLNEFAVYSSIPVTGITLNKSNDSIYSGATDQLTATVQPLNASNKTVTWTSTNPLVATIDSTGKVTGVNTGSTTIKATTSDGGYFAACSISVATPPPVSSVTLNKSIDSINIGTTDTLIDTVLPTGANQNVTWTSNNINVATVDSTGKITAVALGTAIITVKTNDGGFSATCMVTVIPINQLPVANSGNFVTDPTSTYYGNLSAADADNDPLTYSVVTNGTHGLVTVNANGSYSYKPTPYTGYFGNDSFTFKANDGKADSNIATVTVTIQYPVIFGGHNVSGTVITNILPGSTVSNFLTGAIVRSDITPVFKNLNNSSQISTGTTIDVKNTSTGLVLSTYISVIYGDVNGDSAVNLSDLVLIRNYLLGTQILSGMFKQAGNLYGENDITLNDLVGIMSAISGAGSINQNPNTTSSPANYNVSVINNVKYGNATNSDGSLAQIMDVYLPAVETYSNKPTIILIHGGGFSLGDKQQPLYVEMATDYANKGYMAFSINYQLSNVDINNVESVRDRDITDAELALRYIESNYGVDTQKIVLCGDSAGGGIVVKMSYQNENADHIAACLDLWGGMLGTVYQNGTTYLWGGPIYTPNIDSTTPPTLIVHGTADATVPYTDSQALYNRLNAADVKCELFTLNGAPHYPDSYDYIFIPEMLKFTNSLFNIN